MLPVLMLLAADEVDLVATARILTTTEQRCPVANDSTDITVCGLRRADRFRVPFVVHDAGDPRHENAWNERVRLLHRRTPIQEMSPFLVGGGMAGVSYTTRSDGSSEIRPLAP